MKIYCFLVLFGMESECLAKLANDAELPLERIEERLRRVSRIIRNRIGNPLLIGVGESGKRHLPVLSQYMQSEGLDVETAGLDQLGHDEKGYRIIPTQARGMNPNRRPIVLVEKSVRTGNSALSALKWVLENSDDLNPESISLMTLVDTQGISNIILNPQSTHPIGPIEALKRRDPELYERLKGKVERLVKGDVYTFGRNDKWKGENGIISLKLLSIHNPPDNEEHDHDMFRQIIMGTYILSILDFIDGNAVCIYSQPARLNEDKTTAINEFQKEIYILKRILMGFEIPTISSRELVIREGKISQLKEILMDIDENKKTVVVINYHKSGISYAQNDRRSINELSTDEKLGLAVGFSVSRYLTRQGQRNNPNFIFIGSPPSVLSIDDLFLEAFHRGLSMTPSDLGQDVETYCQRELEKVQNPEEYRRDLRVVSTKSARVYGLGLTLALGLERDRYIEFDDEAVYRDVKLPHGARIHQVYLNRVKELTS